MSYNSKQLSAIKSSENNVVISAPPGSGKTHTLIGAIQEYVTENPAKEVVAVTFTVKATNELHARLKTFANITIATIHSWSYTELRKLAKKYKFKIRLLENDAITDILKPMMVQRSIFPNGIGMLLSFVKGNYNMDISDKLKQQFMIVKDDYVAYKRARHLYDFTDLPLYLFTKLCDFEETVKGVDALFVDEFQDVDPIQADIFDRVEATNRFYIGDRDQAIYLFRGATAEIFEDLNDDFTEYELNINYRSYQEILDYASTMKFEAEEALEYGGRFFMGRVDFTDASEIICDKGYGGAVIVGTQKGSLRYVAGADYLSAREALSVELVDHKYQILCRKNKQVRAIEELGFRNVSTVHMAKGLEYPNVLVVDFEIKGIEDLNIAYVAATRAEDRLFVLDYDFLIDYLQHNYTKRRKEQKLF
jgi:superfamily I DNA/RNA helicase